MSEQQTPDSLQTHIPSDLEYCYRDMFTVYAGPEEVILEFGNVHRSIPNQARVANRIVLPVSKAFQLRDSLHRAILEMTRRQREAAGGFPGEEESAQ
ncbi:hypothetical protein JCM15519_30500 [Fundidesulfovibrio butyratiphilus]